MGYGQLRETLAKREVHMGDENGFGRHNLCECSSKAPADSLSGTGMVVLARTNLMAAISLAGTSSLAILLKGSTTTLPVPSRLDLLKSVLAMMRSCSHFGSGLGLVAAATTGSGFGSGPMGGCVELESGSGAPNVAGGSAESIDGVIIGCFGYGGIEVWHCLPCGVMYYEPTCMIMPDGHMIDQ